VVTQRTWRLGLAVVLVSVALSAGQLPATEGEGAGEDAAVAPALRKLDELRALVGCTVAPTADVAQAISFRGRPAIEVKGREPSGDASGTMRDLAIYDLPLARIVSHICFTNASTRKSGEAIISLAEVSGRGDKLARAVLPKSNLELESVKRHRAGGTESVYYEARYASTSGEFPFLEPPVRLLINATTGSLFRLDIDTDWLDPPASPRSRISRKAAERITTVVLRGHDLAPVFGTGAVLGSVGVAEMFMVHPNDWLDLFKDLGEARARAAWVVPFRVDGSGASAGLHSLFVDIATGLVLGGLPAQPANHPPL